MDNGFERLGHIHRCPFRFRGDQPLAQASLRRGVGWRARRKRAPGKVADAGCEGPDRGCVHSCLGVFASFGDGAAVWDHDGPVSRCFESVPAVPAIQLRRAAYIATAMLQLTLISLGNLLHPHFTALLSELLTTYLLLYLYDHWLLTRLLGHREEANQ
jgi:hypothetical protein